MDVAAAVDAPRVHHQWLPDEVRVEHGFADETPWRRCGPRAIAWSNHSARTSANSIAVTDKGLLGAPDHRSRGAGAAGQ